MSGNIGFGVGAGLDFGTITPTGSNQFINSDFSGGGTAYHGGVSTPILGIGYSKGGSSGSGSVGNALDPASFGTNPRGYTTSQPTIAPRGKISVGAMFSSSHTWVY